MHALPPFNRAPECTPRGRPCAPPHAWPWLAFGGDPAELRILSLDGVPEPHLRGGEGRGKGCKLSLRLPKRKAANSEFFLLTKKVMELIHIGLWAARHHGGQCTSHPHPAGYRWPAESTAGRWAWWPQIAESALTQSRPRSPSLPCAAPEEGNTGQTPSESPKGGLY